MRPAYAAAPGPPSLDHNDLHAENVVVASPACFYDWGDAVVAHPFASMLVALGFMQHQVLDCAIDDPRLLRLRDAYLEPFTGLAPRAELVETLELACRVGMTARSLIWHRALTADPAEEIDERFSAAPFATLAAILHEEYLSAR